MAVHIHAFDTMTWYKTVYPDKPAMHMDNPGMLSNKTRNGIYQPGNRIIFKAQVIIFQKPDMEEQK